MIHAEAKATFREETAFGGRGVAAAARALAEDPERRRAGRPGNSQTGQRFVASPLKVGAYLFDFVRGPATEGTNDSAGRARRQCVVTRKVSAGNRSWVRARAGEVLMTAVQCLRSSGQSLLQVGPGYLAAA